MEEPIISVSGLRGIVGRSLTPEVALRYACAFAEEIPAGPLIVGRDGRGSGEMLAHAIFSGLTAAGRKVWNAGVVATPTLGVLVQQHKAAGGIQISASHNPPEYNGMKLFSATGGVLEESVGRRVLAKYREATLDWATHEDVQTVEELPAPHAEHLRRILATVDVPRIQAKRFRVLLDANHGAGSLLGRLLLEALGCEVILLGDRPDGQFAHPPEPLAENLQSVLSQVVVHQADVGFCQDPDADRLALIDETGRYLGEECTLALCVQHRLSQASGPIVINCATSRMTLQIALEHGVPCELSKVGEAHVVAEMKQSQALLGGEGNGGVIDPRVVFVRDSFQGMALILDALAAQETTLSRWAAGLPATAIRKRKFPLDPQQLPAVFAAFQQYWPDASANTKDGLRLDWSDRWLLIRPSNTEPIVRIIAEAPNASTVDALCDEAQRLIEQCIAVEGRRE